MKQAYHVASGRLVNAEDAEHYQFYGIFKCPECNDILHLRAGHETANGSSISASFIHSKDADSKCSFRTTWSQNEPEPIFFRHLPKGQIIKLLNNNFFVAIKSFLENSRYDIRHPKSLPQKKNASPNNFDLETYNLFSKLLSIPQAGSLLLYKSKGFSQKLNKQKKELLKFTEFLNPSQYQNLQDQELDLFQKSIQRSILELELQGLQGRYNTKSVSLDLMVKEQCRLLREISLTFVSALKSDVRNKALYEIFIRSSLHFKPSHNSLLKQDDLSGFLSSFYSKKVPEDEMEFTDYCGNLLMETFAYIDWAELFYSWQMSRRYH